MRMAVLPLNHLPVGYRFRPTDEELISFYLQLKINGEESKVGAIAEVDVCKCEPWELPKLSVIKNEDPEWFFFCPRDQKYPKGKRSNRATDAGYWKATGKDRTIKSKSLGMKLIGMKKTLVFHRGRAPGGQRTGWIMHEYRMSSDEGPYVLCRLFDKDKVEDANYDEIEPTGCYPTSIHSSPIGMPPEQALVHENSESNMQVGEESTEQSYSNSCQASDVEDSRTEVRATEMGQQKGEYTSILNDATIEAPDYQAWSPLHSEKYTGLELSHMDSPYASDFGNTHNAIPFQDGSSEKDYLVPGFSVKGFCDETEVASSLFHNPCQAPTDASLLIGASQGTTIRRIRLQGRLASGTAISKRRESHTTAKDQEAKPTVSEMVYFQSSVVYNEISQEPKTKLKLRSRWRRNNASDREDASLIEAARIVRPLSYSSRYMVFMALIIILFVFFIGGMEMLGNLNIIPSFNSILGHTVNPEMV